MMKKLFTLFMTAMCCLLPLTAVAQLEPYTTKGLSKNPDKFLGNITTGYQMDPGGISEKYYQLWNQVTPENESKWGSVEANRGQFNWNCDTPFNYAKTNGFIFKFHAFLWGAQYPDRWFNENLPQPERFKAVVEWFDAIKKKYSHLPMVDVVNEAIGMHQQGNPLIKATMGGGGKTGYDWLIKAFEMAYERFPNSILIYNDFNSLLPQNGDVDNYITLVKTLRDAGAPIDAYGNQSHDVDNISASTLSDVLKKQQDALKMPMYITELDINIADNAKQKAQYQSIFPIMWEAEYCAGVTIWGFIYGSTWVDNSGLIRNGTDRPAMEWLREYMQTDKAKNAKSPYPGMRKRVGVYVHPRDTKIAKGDVMPVKVRTHITDDAKAENADIAIEKVELYAGVNLIATMTEEPYVADYTAPETSGTKTLKAIVYTNDGNTYERYAQISVLSGTTKRAPYNGTPVELPGTIQSGEYDLGLSGVSYNNAVGRTGTAVTKNDGWMEYTVDVKESGIYSYDIEVASAKTGGIFHLSEYGLDNLTFLSDFIEVPSTGSNDNYQTLHGVLTEELTAGRHTICLNTDVGGFYIKSITLKPYKQDNSISVSVTSVTPSTIFVGESTTVNVTARSNSSTIDNVKVYANGLLVGTMTEAPYSFEFTPAAKGSYTITAIATDVDGNESKVAKSSTTLRVKAVRAPYKGTAVTLPGTIQAENFDEGGEGLAFHDLNADGQGDAQSYRDDAEGADIVKGNSGYAIGYTETREWLEYTVNVQKAGKYTYEATVSSGVNTSSFRIRLHEGNNFITLADVAVPQTASNSWSTYKTVKGELSQELKEGEQILRFTITGGNCNIDKVRFIYVEPDAIEDVTAGEGTLPDGTKVIENGQFVIYRGGKKYNAVGVEVK